MLYRLILLSIIVIVFIFLATPCLYSSGTATLKGKVFDASSGTPLPGAAIMFVSYEIGGLSDLHGNFVINDIPPGTYRIKAVLFDYSGIEFPSITLYADSTLNLNIYLNRRPEDMRGTVGPPKRPKGIKKYIKKEILTSTAFYFSGMIPPEFTCDGADISPPLQIKEAIEEANSLAIIFDESDAPGVENVHWILFNIPPGIDELPENIEKVIYPDLKSDQEKIQPVQGRNDYGNIGYNGPCPPPEGRLRQYSFKLYALDTVLVFKEEEIQKGITKDQLLNAIQGHTLAEYALMGRYGR